MQRGSVFKRHGAWHVVYRITEVVSGQPVRKQVTKRLAAVGDECRTVSDARLLAQDHLRPMNLGSITPEGSMTVSDFAQKYFLPAVVAKKKPSTAKFYKDLVDNHLDPLLGTIRLRDVSTLDVQRLLDARASLSQASVLRIKTGASALLSHAIRLGFVHGANVAREARAEGKRTDADTYAYNLDEVLLMLECARARTHCDRCRCVRGATGVGDTRTEMGGLRRRFPPHSEGGLAHPRRRYKNFGE